MLPQSAYVFIYVRMNESVHVCVSKADISVLYCIIFCIEHVNSVPNRVETPRGPLDTLSQ
jgi:hypothetical protein